MIRFLFYLMFCTLPSADVLACMFYPIAEKAEIKLSDIVFRGELVEHSQCGDEYDYAKFKIRDVTKGTPDGAFQNIYFWNCRDPQALHIGQNYKVYAYRLAIYDDIKDHTQYAPTYQLSPCTAGITPIDSDK